MPDEPDQFIDETTAETDVGEPATFFDALHYPHREALAEALTWLVDLAFAAVAITQRDRPAGISGLVRALPSRWRGRYDEDFCWRFAVCAVVVGLKLRIADPRRGYMTSCVAEELALDLAVRRARTLVERATGTAAGAGDDFDWLLEVACADRSYDVLYFAGEHRPHERALESVGIWRTDLRYRSLFRTFAHHDPPPVHPSVDPDQDWWRTTPEPPPDDYAPE